METLAKAFVDHHPASQTHQDESTLFPQSGLVAQSISLTTANAFGFHRLDQVYSARYRWWDGEAGAFLSQRQSPVEAAQLARAYVDFLIEYDAQPLSDPQLDKNMYLLDIYGTFEIVFHWGSFLAGVHEADNLKRGMALARRLKANLQGTAQ
jgi:hypothetical protein